MYTCPSIKTLPEACSQHVHSRTEVLPCCVEPPAVVALRKGGAITEFGHEITAKVSQDFSKKRARATLYKAQFQSVCQQQSSTIYSVFQPMLVLVAFEARKKFLGPILIGCFVGHCFCHGGHHGEGTVVRYV